MGSSLSLEMGALWDEAAARASWGSMTHGFLLVHCTRNLTRTASVFHEFSCRANKMLRRVRWEWAILRLLITSLRNTSVNSAYSHHTHHREAHEFAPNSQSYQRLAVLW